MIERIKQRAHLVRPLLIPLIFYIGLLAFSTSWLADNPASPWRTAATLLPLIPGFFIMYGVIRAISQLDELERKHLTDGILISFSGTFILTLTLGLLSQAGFPQPNSIYIALVMAVLWLGGKLWSQRKYQ